MTEQVSYGRRISDLAASHPEHPAIVEVAENGAEQQITWGEFNRRSTQAAHLLEQHSVGPGDMVVVALPNGIDHLVAEVAIWKLGACVLPLAPKLPSAERDRLLSLAQPAVLIADWPDVTAIASDDLTAAAALSPEPLPDRIPQPGRAMASGGSTGRPKLILLTGPLAGTPGDTGLFGTIGGLQEEQVQLVAGPLHHNMPHSWAHAGLFHDHTLVVMRRFDANLALDLIERYRVGFASLVPTHLHRMLLPDIWQRDLSSIRSILHAGAPCASWLKRKWIELLGPQRVYEGYGATEAIGFTVIRGDEWLQHPGSVGRPVVCDLEILDPDDRHPLGPGEVGEIFMRPHTGEPPFSYIGAPQPATTPDGYVSVGDLGWLDTDGYLYIADRRTDLIITGGANVYPTEVEAALSEHPEVADVAVVGLPDPERGQCIHAVVQPHSSSPPPDPQQLLNHCRSRLAPYKVPRTVEFVERLPRDDMGKLRRHDLAQPHRATPAQPAGAEGHEGGG